ncbi:MAG: hypothetical protein GY739_15440, partial [Mesoflavibacter sp.]|nr:hypothetical protein [Mesoflavibacter sp.]
HRYLPVVAKVVGDLYVTRLQRGRKTKRLTQAAEREYGGVESGLIANALAAENQLEDCRHDGVEMKARMMAMEKALEESRKEIQLLQASSWRHGHHEPTQPSQASAAGLENTAYRLTALEWKLYAQGVLKGATTIPPGGRRPDDDGQRASGSGRGQ